VTKQTSRPYLTRLLSVGIFQGKIYLNNQPSLEELKHNIEQTVANINPETL
jgi:hypothetical protein